MTWDAARELERQNLEGLWQELDWAEDAWEHAGQEYDECSSDDPKAVSRLYDEMDDAEDAWIEAQWAVLDTYGVNRNDVPSLLEREEELERLRKRHNRLVKAGLLVTLALPELESA